MMDFIAEDAHAIFKSYFETQTTRLLELQSKYPEEKAFKLSFNELDKHFPDFAEFMLVKAQMCLSIGSEELQDATQLDDVELTIVELPNDVHVPINKIRNEHIGKMIAMSGIVKKVSDIRPLTTMAAFKCARCPAIIYEPQEGLVFHEPLECYKDQNGCGRTAGSTRFKFLPNDSSYLDYQKLEIQESPENLNGKANASSMMCYLTKELVGHIRAGDRVILNGILEIERTKDKVSSGLHALIFKVLSVEHNQEDYDNIELTEEDEELIKVLSQDPKVFDILANEIAPSIEGYREIKESMLLQLFGGTSSEIDGQKIRGNIHLLLVGDPGVAKTTMLEYQRILAPRSVFASGKNASSAGLTAAVVKDTMDKDRWVLEAGALVLADKGLAIIDELDKMKDEDRSALHLAMEQQFINVTKATLNIDLPTRTSVLGALNPKYSRFDPLQPINEQINLEPTLLSRFDLIHVMRDFGDPKMDESISKKILDNHLKGEMQQHCTEQSTGITKQFIRKYIAMAKKVFPVMNAEAIDILQKNWCDARNKGRARNITSITPRQLQALIRLSEASARVRLSTEVTADDARRAVSMLVNSLNQVSPDGDIDVIMSGVSHKDKDKIQIVKNIIRESDNGMISIDKLKIRAFAKGLDDQETEKVLEKIDRERELVRPKYGWVSLI